MRILLPWRLNYSNKTGHMPEKNRGTASNFKEMSRLMTKPTKWSVCPAKTWLAGRMNKDWVLSFPLGSQRRWIRLGGCPGWSESSLGAHAILLVLSWGGSNGLKPLKSILREKFQSIIPVKLLTYYCLTCDEGDLGIHSKSRSDITEISIWSGSGFTLFA